MNKHLVKPLQRWQECLMVKAYKIGSMPTELKLDTVICQDIEELEFSSSNDDKVNVVHKLLDTFLRQGKWSKNNITTPKERPVTTATIRPTACINIRVFCMEKLMTS